MGTMTAAKSNVVSMLDEVVVRARQLRQEESTRIIEVSPGMREPQVFKGARRSPRARRDYRGSRGPARRLAWPARIGRY